MCWSLNHVQLFVTPWIVAHQAPLSIGFSRLEYWSGLPCPPLGDLPDRGIESTSPALQMDSLLLSHWESPRLMAWICLQCRRPGFDPWVGKILWRRKWQAIPRFLPGEFHGQRSLVGYNPWSHKELDMTEQLTLSFLSCWIIWVGVI